MNLNGTTCFQTADLHWAGLVWFGLQGLTAAINSTPRTFPSTRRPMSRQQTLHKWTVRATRDYSHNRTHRHTELSGRVAQQWKDVNVKVRCAATASQRKRKLFSFEQSKKKTVHFSRIYILASVVCAPGGINYGFINVQVLFCQCGKTPGMIMNYSFAFAFHPSGHVPIWASSSTRHFAWQLNKLVFPVEVVNRVEEGKKTRGLTTFEPHALNKLISRAKTEMDMLLVRLRVKEGSRGSRMRW